MTKFRVSFYQDELYEVCEWDPEADAWKGAYIGPLANCEAYIRLIQNEEVEFGG